MIRYILIACILPLFLASASANELEGEGHKLDLKPLVLDLKPLVIDASVEPVATITLPKNSCAKILGSEIMLSGSKIPLKLDGQHFSVVTFRKDGSLDRVTVYPAAALKRRP